MVNVLADITGPGSLGLQGDPQNFLIVSGKSHVPSCFVTFVTSGLSQSFEEGGFVVGVGS